MFDEDEPFKVNDKTVEITAANFFPDQKLGEMLREWIKETVSMAPLSIVMKDVKIEINLTDAFPQSFDTVEYGKKATVELKYHKLEAKITVNGATHNLELAFEEKPSPLVTGFPRGFGE